MLSLVAARHAVEGLLSAVILNIVVGLITSLIGAGSVWVWGRARVTRRQRERALFFGVSPGDTCRIVAPAANMRMQSHLARFLPGVSVLPPPLSRSSRPRSSPRARSSSGSEMPVNTSW